MSIEEAYDFPVQNDEAKVIIKKIKNDCLYKS